jgi:hypothetical protein
VNGLQSGDVGKDARLHHGRGGGHVYVQGQVLAFEVLFISTRFTAD